MSFRLAVLAFLLVPAIGLAQQALPTKPEAEIEKPAAKPEAKPAAKPAAKAPASGNVAKVNGVAVPRSRMDVVMQEQQQRGMQDNVQTRAMLRDELINREVVAQEAQRAGFAKRPEVQAQLDLARQQIIVNAYIRDWVAKNPASDDEVQKQYDSAKAQAVNEREYRARHILLETEDEAKSVITQLKKGGKFDELARKNSKDPGSKERGGDLDWNVPQTFDRQFSDAMVKLEKGKYTETPVRTRFGYHVIQLDDVRAMPFPELADVKPRIQQQVMQMKVDELVRGLRAKAKVE
jgi:peptidyl-prolyl cis-trans isomerase C